MTTPVYILIMVGLLMASAYFSATETAFSACNKTRMKTMAEKGNRRAQTVCALSEDYDRLISTILVGNNIVNIALASMGTVIFVKYFGDIGATLSTVAVTITVLIFGEISPKSIAKDNPERFAMMSAPVIRFLILILAPVNFLFSQWKKLLTRIIHTNNVEKMSQEELLMLVEEVQQDGTIDSSEGNLLRNAIEFTERRAEDILTHRMDLEGVPEDATKQEIAEKFAETRYSRILVYRETMDDILGVLCLKDFYTTDGITTLPTAELITSVVFVQQKEKISDLLKLLQKNKTHIAVVLDEYGGTVGIVTMEDILEELVGEIWDEHDEVMETFRQINDRLYEVDCSVNLADFCDFFQCSLEEESEAVSLGGFIMDMLDRIPEVGESLECAGLRITVTATDAHRITEASVELLATDAPSAENPQEK